jgi:hypothetical protein
VQVTSIQNVPPPGLVLKPAELFSAGKAPFSFLQHFYYFLFEEAARKEPISGGITYLFKIFKIKLTVFIIYSFSQRRSVNLD